MQRLYSLEEGALERFVQATGKLEIPLARISQLREMAEKLLRDKVDIKSLGG
jgi:hypothetical protein